MQHGNLNDLLAFIAVARERSFTKAAAKLGVSQPALSHTVRELEARLGIRLLTRTTRSVAPTEVGDRLLRIIGPRFEDIEAELAAVTELRQKPAGTIRITAGEHAAHTVLWPAVAKLVAEYPDIHVEIVVDHALRDIVAERYDAGVREEMLRRMQQKDPKVAEFGSLLNFQRPALRDLTQEEREVLFDQFLKWLNEGVTVQR